MVMSKVKVLAEVTLWTVAGVSDEEYRLSDWNISCN